MVRHGEVMTMMPEHMTAENWMRHIFSSKTAREGGVVRRRVSDVTRIVGVPNFEAEVRRRGYRAVQNGRHYVVFCNRESIRFIE
jgi:hypothetical protein